MPKINIKYECRAPEGLSTMTTQEQYKNTLDQIRWVDQQNVPVTINFCEHHGSDDDYISGPMMLASAVAAITDNVRLRTNVIIPFHNPLRVAEDIATLDLISNGRAEVLALAGYLPSELEMFGVDPKQRGILMEEGVEALRNAWTGEFFEYQGRKCRIRPRPVQQPNPPIVMGGAVPAAARRAARIGDAFCAAVPEAYPTYEAECLKLGKTPINEGKLAFGFLHLSEDPDATWEQIAPFAHYETNCYARWMNDGGIDRMFDESVDYDELRKNGPYTVMTPEQCIEACKELDDDATIMMHPLMAGLPLDIANNTVKLFFERVVPHLDVSFRD